MRRTVIHSALHYNNHAVPEDSGIPDGGIKSIQDSFFIGAPEGRNQKLLRTIAGDSVNDGLWRKQLQTRDHDAGVFLQSQDREGCFLIFRSQLGTLKDMEKLKLDAIRKFQPGP